MASDERNFFTISLQFPHHQAGPVRVRLHETSEPGRYRVKMNHAWASKSPMNLDAALALVKSSVQNSLGLSLDEKPEPMPNLHIGHQVTLPGEFEKHSGVEGCESRLFRIISPPFEHASDGWCVFVGHGLHPLSTARRVRCRDLRPAYAFQDVGGARA